MPYDYEGNWIPPEGFENVDQEEMFQEAVADPTDIIETMLTGYAYWENFTASYGTEDGEVVGDPVTGIAIESIDDIYGAISNYITPFDQREISSLKKSANAEKAQGLEAVYAGSMQARNLAGKGGFASSFQGARATGDLWSQYINKNKEINKSLSSSIYRAKGDYLDSMFTEVAEVWDTMYGG